MVPSLLSSFLSSIVREAVNAASSPNEAPPRFGVASRNIASRPLCIVARKPSSPPSSSHFLFSPSASLLRATLAPPLTRGIFVRGPPAFEKALSRLISPFGMHPLLSRGSCVFSLSRADAGRRRRGKEGGRGECLEAEKAPPKGTIVKGRGRGQRTPESAKESDFGRCFFLPSSSLPLGRVLFLSLVCIRAIACKL